jgi:hypothetical protein
MLQQLGLLDSHYRTCVRLSAFFSAIHPAGELLGAVAPDGNGKGSRVLFSCRYGCYRGLASKPSTQPLSSKPIASCKVGCPWQMTVTCYRVAPNQLKVEFPTAHEGHTPGSAEDNRWLKPSAELLDEAKDLLVKGLKPMQVMSVLDGRLDSELLVQSDDSWADSFNNGRRRLTLADLKRLQKIIRRDTLIDESDVRAVDSLMAILQDAEDRVVLHYQPQVVEKGKVKMPLVIIISSPFQRRLLHTFGSRLCLLDATGKRQS